MSIQLTFEKVCRHHRKRGRLTQSYSQRIILKSQFATKVTKITVQLTFVKCCQHHRKRGRLAQSYSQG